MRKKFVHLLDESQNESSDDLSKNYNMYSIMSSSKQNPYRVEVEMNNNAIQMEIDTGALLSLVSEHTLRDSWPELNLSSNQVVLHSYSGESIPELGTVNVVVSSTVIRQPHHLC